MRRTLIAVATAGLAACATTGSPGPWPSQPMCMPCTDPCFPIPNCSGAPKAAAPAPAPAPVAAPAPAPVSPAAPPAFSPPPGTYTGAQMVTLSSATPNATIHYTTDGSEPTAASPVYSGPISVSGNTTIRALARAGGMPDSSLTAGGYNIQAPPPPPPPPPPAAPARVVVTEKKIELKEKVFFDTAKASIKAESNSLLDEVAEVMKAHPEVKKVVVEGHTDNRGDAAKNQKLSEARAQAVKAYLVGKGVEGARLDAKGYGQSKPIADNKTAKGRDENRRVELTIAQ